MIEKRRRDFHVEGRCRGWWFWEWGLNVVGHVVSVAVVAWLADRIWGKLWKLCPKLCPLHSPTSVHFKKRRWN